jgi:hypothetical protein
MDGTVSLRGWASLDDRVSTLQGIHYDQAPKLIWAYLD